MNFFKNKFYLSLTVGILSFLALLVSILWAGGFIAGYTDRETESKTIKKVLTVGNSFDDGSVFFPKLLISSRIQYSLYKSQYRRMFACKAREPDQCLRRGLNTETLCKRVLPERFAAGRQL